MGWRRERENTSNIENHWKNERKIIVLMLQKFNTNIYTEKEKIEEMEERTIM